MTGAKGRHRPVVCPVDNCKEIQNPMFWRWRGTAKGFSVVGWGYCPTHGPVARPKPKGVQP